MRREGNGKVFVVDGWDFLFICFMERRAVQGREVSSDLLSCVVGCAL